MRLVDVSESLSINPEYVKAIELDTETNYTRVHIDLGAESSFLTDIPFSVARNIFNMEWDKKFSEIARNVEQLAAYQQRTVV